MEFSAMAYFPDTLNSYNFQIQNINYEHNQYYNINKQVVSNSYEYVPENFVTSQDPYFYNQFSFYQTIPSKSTIYSLSSQEFGDAGKTFPYTGTKEIEEMVNWLCGNENQCNIEQILKEISNENWIEVSERKTDIISETKYCDPDALKEVVEAKEIFDELDQFELTKARSRSNPFETIKSAFFMNRAALKMANIDAATGFLFTTIERQIEHRQSKAPFYFADICAGPGSFSEYIFWRKKWAYKGFGLTLRGDNDFRLYESTCAPCETFEALYGPRQDGNIYYPENITDFCTRVKNDTDGKGVHFIMGDGGFSVEGEEHIQEILSRQLYTCQCFLALTALRTNGHFVVKLFDLFTEYSVGLIYLMYLCFDKVAIFKPNASRPANSERYLICCKKKPDEEISTIRKYLQLVVNKFFEIRNKEEFKQLDINKIVPENIINSDIQFVKYMMNSNNSLAKKQTVALRKLGLFCRDSALIEPRQEDYRKLSLAFWNIPDRQRKPWPKLTVNQLIKCFIINPKELLCGYSGTISCLELAQIFEEPKNYHFAYVSSTDCDSNFNIYIGLGQNKVFKYNKKKWTKISNVDLLRGSIIFAEVVSEYLPEEATTRNSLHLIDALRLGDTNLADLPYSERKILIDIYCKAVNKNSRSDLIPITSKNVMPVAEFPKEILSDVSCNNTNFSWKFKPKSLLFLQIDSTQHFCTTVSSGRFLHIPYNENEQNNCDTILWKYAQQLAERRN